MSSPIVFSLTAAQCRVLQSFADGKTENIPERTLSQMMLKGLVSNSLGWALTPAGEAAALLVARLSEASPISGGSGGGDGCNSDEQRSLQESNSLGIYAKSVNRESEKSQRNKVVSKPGLSRLANFLLQSAGFTRGPEDKLELVCELAPEDWELVITHDARHEVLRQAERYGEAGLRKLLAELRSRSTHQNGGASSRRSG